MVPLLVPPVSVALQKLLTQDTVTASKAAQIWQAMQTLKTEMTVYIAWRWKVLIPLPQTRKRNKSHVLSHLHHLLLLVMVTSRQNTPCLCRVVVHHAHSPRVPTKLKDSWPKTNNSQHHSSSNHSNNHKTSRSPSSQNQRQAALRFSLVDLNVSSQGFWLKRCLWRYSSEWLYVGPWGTKCFVIILLLPRAG